jgi:adenine-specific DNA-methyltransferase
MARDGKRIETLTHTEATRKNIPTAELQALVEADDAAPKPVRYPRNADLDPQLVWRGKDEQDWSDLVVPAPPLYIQEKIHPKAIIDDLQRRTRDRRGEQVGAQLSFFDDFNGLPDPEARLEFYQHDGHWSNRMILGDSLQVMASLAEKEGLRGQVQCIYLDPPYGIKFNSNWQVSTRSRDVKDGKIDQISREPEQVKAFRDTWKDGIHSYLTYLRDRLTVARDLLSESGSVFVQIGDENVHRVRDVMDEVFGAENCCAQIVASKTTGQSADLLAGTCDYILWYAKKIDVIKFRKSLQKKSADLDLANVYRWVADDDGSIRPIGDADEKKQLYRDCPERVLRFDNIVSQRPPGDFPVNFQGRVFGPGKGYWKTGEKGFQLLIRAGRLRAAKNSLNYIRFISDFGAMERSNHWTDTGTGSFTEDKVYVVQTSSKIIQRCLLMATDPGDLVLDPTCGSGTTAYVAEHWGRRWITIDTSRVALALARARLMGARYPFYHLADSPEGLAKESEASGTLPVAKPTHGDIRQGFVYQRVPHITLKSIANNAEIDVLWDRWQQTLEPLREQLNAVLGGSAAYSSQRHKEHKAGHEEKEKEKENNKTPVGNYFSEEYQIPRNPETDWPDAAKAIHAQWWEAWIQRQKDIDKSISDRAEQEYLYDKPYEDNARTRVSGPFTVESLSPHRVLAADDDDFVDPAARPRPEQTDFSQMVLDHLKTSGVHQGDKKNRITFTSVGPWPGTTIAAEGRFMEGETERRAAITIGPEFGTLARPDLVAAAREAAEAGFRLLIACAFNYDAHASEFSKLGPVQVIRARMNPDLHMADELKNTGTGNLFVVFGEPDVEIDRLKDGQLQVRILGLDIFDPQKGEVRPGGIDDIAAWFIDTDYNEESFFVRHAYFLGAQDPYKALKTTLKAEIDEDAWASLYRNVSRPFPRPTSGRLAVKVINHFGDEVMKVFSV